jgi:hypothetical protein
MIVLTAYLIAMMTIVARQAGRSRGAGPDGVSLGAGGAMACLAALELTAGMQPS